MERPLISSEQHPGYAPLPALPQALLKLVELSRTRGISESNLVNVIATDPALTIQTFKTAKAIQPDVCSSPLYLDKAVSSLGVENIRLMATKVLTFQNGREGENEDRDLINFWRHSLLCANIASRFAAQLGVSSPDTAYLAGLLHDSGKLLYRPDASAPRPAQQKHGSRRHAAGEADPGTPPDHCETGARYVYTCCNNLYISDAIRYHHDSLQRVRGAFPLVKIIYLANLLSNEIHGGEALSYGAAETLFEVPSRTVDGIAISAKDETSKISISYGVGATSFALNSVVDFKPGENQAIKSEVARASMFAGVLEQLMYATERQAVLQILVNAVQIEFELPQPVFFQYTKTRRRLTGQIRQGTGGPEYNQELVINLDKTGGLMVEAFNKNCIRHSLESSHKQEMSLADHQVHHLLGTSEMLCVPVNGRQTTLGLLVMGFDEHQMSFPDNYLETIEKLTDYTGMRLDDIMRPNIPATPEDYSARSQDLVTRKMIHEVNNPLSIIKNYLGVLKVKLPESHPVQNETGIIEEEIDRIKAILAQYSDFYASDNNDERVNVNTLIEDLLALMETSLKPSSLLKFNTHLDSMVPRFSSNKGKLKQIILNLLLNAAEAMPEGGDVLIQTQYIPASVIGDETSRLNISGKVQIIIKDNGPGISDEIKSSLFLPFKTSKAGKFSGLGLSIVYNLLLELDGTITCDSTKTEGTMFTIILPVHD